MARLQMGSRADRWEQRVDKALELVPAQLVLMGLMFLRGPQTLNELLTRSNRLHDFEDVDQVQHQLERLISRGLACTCRARPASARTATPTPWATRPKSRRSSPRVSRRVAHAAVPAVSRRSASKRWKRGLPRWRSAWPSWKAEVRAWCFGEVATALALGHFALAGALVDKHGTAVCVDFQVAPVQVLLFLPGLGWHEPPGFAADQGHGCDS
jgi:hypothetical protein